MFKRLFLHSAIYAFAPQLPRLVSIVVLPLITAHLTAEDYGIAATITAFTGLLGGIAELGMTVPIVNAYYYHPHRWKLVWQMLYGYLIIWGLAFNILQFIIVYAVIPSKAQDNAFLIATLICIPSFLSNGLGTLASRYYQIVKRNPTYIGIVSAITGSIGIFLNYYTIAVLKMGYMGWYWSSFATGILSVLAWGYPIFGKLRLYPIFRLKSKFLLKQLKVALPLVPHNYSSYLLNASDRLVMSLYKIPLANMGIYNVAYMFGSYFDFAGTAIGMAFGPITTEHFALRTREAELKIRHLIFLMQSFFIIVGFLLCVWMKEILQFLIRNETLQSAYPLSIIIIMGYTYRPMYWAVVNKLSYYEKTSLLWRISFIGGLINVLLNLVFIPIYGFEAAAYTTYFALLYVGFSGYFLETFKRLNQLKYYPGWWMSAIIVFTIAAFLIKDLNVTYKIVINAVVLGIGGIIVFRNRYRFSKTRATPASQ